MCKSLVHVVAHNMRRQREIQPGISTNLMQKRKELLININKNHLHEELPYGNLSLPITEISGVGEGKTGGRARLFLCVGWEVGGAFATSGSNSHGETLSGRKIDEGSSH